ncbi:MAG TPA: Ni/Fe hydrogenase subunit alpha [Mycobacteriales bacterium]|nr:Ni/Fe hydrogenase subunit alpha [Mycobacteriales bacterium]
MTHKSDRMLSAANIARVEGEGAMHIHVLNGAVSEVQLQIYEPPRFFEAFLRGRAYTEPPDITARICGICPVAYQMSACQAIEDACGAVVLEPIRRLRRLLYCGEWIESHALHIFLLHAPDFLGYPSAIEMARDHRALVERGLRLKKAGNTIMTMVGGRAIHPVNVRIGGFYRLPTVDELATLRPLLVAAREDALATVEDVARFDFPDLEHDRPYVSLRTGQDYPIERGTIVSSVGLSFPASRFDEHIVEEHVEYSTALHSRLHGHGPYLVGPLARYSLCSDLLHPLARQAAAAARLEATCRNPFRSIVVRAVELVEALDEAVRIIETWDGAPSPAIEVRARAATGYGVTEAPRGLLYHRYTLAADGTIRDATIVPPTAQNQASIEADLRAFVQPRLDLPTDELTRQCEQAIRNYDPCISCSAHFLDLTVEQL